MRGSMQLGERTRSWRSVWEQADRVEKAIRAADDNCGVWLDSRWMWCTWKARCLEEEGCFRVWKSPEFKYWARILIRWVTLGKPRKMQNVTFLEWDLYCSHVSCHGISGSFAIHGWKWYLNWLVDIMKSIQLSLFKVHWCLCGVERERVVE